MHGVAETRAGTPAAQAGAPARTGPGMSAAGTLVIVAVTAAILLALAYLSDRHDNAATTGGSMASVQASYTHLHQLLA